VFDIGFGELLLIAVVALVVLGPERLPKAARFAGLWVRRARNQWDSVKQELERELHAEELKRNLDAVRQSMQQAEREMRDGAHQVQQQAEALRHDVEGEEREAGRGDGMHEVGAVHAPAGAATALPADESATVAAEPEAPASSSAAGERAP